jgi:hypothetical protein
VPHSGCHSPSPQVRPRNLDFAMALEAPGQRVAEPGGTRQLKETLAEDKVGPKDH